MLSAPYSTCFRFEAIGAQWEIETPEPLPEALRREVLARIAGFDAVYSRFRPDSLVACMAQAETGGRFGFPEDGLALFDLYDQLHAVTDGAVDPLVGRDLERLGYDRHYSLQSSSERLAPGRLSWSRNVERDGTVLVTQGPVVVDVGAVGKGCLVDLLAALLADAGQDELLIDASGDMRHAGHRSVRVGLEHPRDTSLAIGVVELKDRAICASATNRRAWGNGLHHVLDARTGEPVRDVIATWAVAKDAATADGLATALFFVDAERLAAMFQFSFLRMFADGRPEVSPNFDGELFR